MKKIKIFLTTLIFSIILVPILTAKALDSEKNFESSRQAGVIQTLIGLDNNCGVINENSNFYAGLYLDKNSNLVVQIVKENIPKEDSNSYTIYQNIIDTNPIIEYVKHSHKELCSVRNELETKIEELNYTNYSYISDDIMNNRIEIALKKYSNKEINKFKETIIDSPLIHFVKGSNLTTLMNTTPDNIKIIILVTSSIILISGATFIIIKKNKKIERK